MPKGIKGFQKEHKSFHTEKTIEKIRKSMIGKVQSEISKRKKSIALRGNKNSLGYKHSDELKRRRSKIAKEKGIGKWMKGRIGKESNSWRSGTSFEPYTIDWTETLRQSIRERDKYTCCLCGKSQSDIAHDVHHIDYNKKNCNPNNLITLCHNCHTKTSFNRNYWLSYFNEKWP